MSHVLSGFSDKQLQVVHELGSPDEIANSCPQNFNEFSECYAAISFNFANTEGLNYTIFVDGGLAHVDVVKHKSDYEKRVLPLQWAVDSVRVLFEFSTVMIVDQTTGNNRTCHQCDSVNSIGMAVYARNKQGAIHEDTAQ